MKKETKIKASLVASAIIILFATLFFYRAPALWSCIKDQYNLKRDTHFSMFFGRCTVDTPKGRVYVDTLRGYDNTENDQNLN